MRRHHCQIIESDKKHGNLYTVNRVASQNFNSSPFSLSFQDTNTNTKYVQVSIQVLFLMAICLKVRSILFPHCFDNHVWWLFYCSFVIFISTLFWPCISCVSVFCEELFISVFWFVLILYVYMCFNSVLVLLWQIQMDLGPRDTSTVLNFSPIVFNYRFTLLSIKCEPSADEMGKRDVITSWSSNC